MEFYQTELELGVTSVSGNPHAPSKPTYDPYWDELLRKEQSACKKVGEQVSQETKQFVHQPKYTHFIERYWVEKAGVKYWYYRYAWKEGRKLKRKYLGSVMSTKAKNKRRMVEEMILEDFTPQEIKDAIANFSTNAQTH